jgi:hypothetical protein
MIGGDAVLASTTGLVAGVLKVDARIPAGVQTGNAMPVFVVLGDPNSDTDSASQSGVTIAVQSNPGVIATTTSIGLASAVTADQDGNVYFVSSNSVFRVDSKGGFNRIAGNLKPGYSGDGGPATAAQISNPRGLAVDGTGNLYIADTGAVRRVSSAGTITTVAPFGGLVL